MIEGNDYGLLYFFLGSGVLFVVAILVIGAVAAIISRRVP